MNRSRRLKSTTFWALCLLAAVALLGGCLEREEEVRVNPDGSMDVRHIIHGDLADLEGGAASLPGVAHYTIERAVRRPGADDEEHVLTARAHFAPDEYPDSFARPGDAFATTAMRFTTDVRVQTEGNTTTYLFVRRYRPRRWADYEYHWRRAFPDEVQKILDSGPIETRKASELRRVLEAIREFESGKNCTWAREALKTVGVKEDDRLLAELATAGAIDEFCQNELHSGGLEALLRESPEEIERRALALQEQLDEISTASAATALQLDAVDRDRYLQELRRLRQDFDVTQDLEDENFKVRVTLPGMVVSHNGESRFGNTVTWEFDGKDLRDREMVLIARSVISH